MIPFLDTWRDDNLTLGYDFGPGELVTQGGSIRYVDKPKREGSVLTGVPLIDRGNEEPTEPEIINVSPVDSIKDDVVTLRYDVGPGELKTQGGNIEYEEKPDDSLDKVLALVDTFNPGKRYAPEQEVIDVPPAPFSQKEIEMRQAEQALQEEREADAQVGSEGYEAKEDGVFSRLKSFGSNVGDFILGKQGKKEWDDFRADVTERGLGAITERANTLMENMARSPYARFVDPTTVLGGQQRMVNDVDTYHYQHSLGALRDELLKQDLVDRQTTLGQAERYVAKTPEERAIIDQFMKNKRAQLGSMFNIKNEENARMAAREEFKNQYGRYPNQEEADALYESYGISKPTPKVNNYDQYILNRAKDLKKANPSLSDTDALTQAGQELDEAVAQSPALANRLQKTYTRSVREVAEIEQDKKAAAKWDKDLEEVQKNSLIRPRMIASSLQAAKMIRADNNLVGGGPVGEWLRKWGNALGLSSPDYQVLDVIMNDVKGDQMASIIASQNSGSISNYERELFSRQCANLGDTPRAAITRLELYALSLRLSQAAEKKMEELSGLPPREREQAMQKFYNDRQADVERMTYAIIANNMGDDYANA